MKVKYIIRRKSNTVEIQSGFSSFEVIDYEGKTIAGNCTHTVKLRNRALGKLSK